MKSIRSQLLCYLWLLTTGCETPNLDVDLDSLALSIGLPNGLSTAREGECSGPELECEKKAVEQLSASLCHDIESEQIRARCISAIASELRAPELCRQAGGDLAVRICAYDGARKFADLAFCEILDRGARIACLKETAKVTTSRQICALIDDAHERANCLRGSRAVRRDPNACDDIKDPVDEASCRLEAPWLVDNPRALCQKFPEEEERDHCYEVLSTVQPQLCSLAGEKSEACFFNAVKRTSASACAKLSEEDHRAVCLGFAAAYQQNTGLCTNGLSKVGRVRCVATYGNSYGNPAECLTFRGDSLDACVALLSPDKRDQKLCSALAPALQEKYCARK
jgi:hypothetical protein